MILLTGGTGLIGRHILAALQQRGHRVLALCRASSADLLRASTEVLVGDVAEERSWQQVNGVEAIIHSAATVFTRGPWADYQPVNVDATRLAAQCARRLGVPLIHISSIAVYDRHSSRPVDERHPIGSLTSGHFYHRSKRLAEQVVWQERARGLETIVLRPWVVYGEGDRLFLPRLIGLARRGWFPMVGNGQEPLPLVYAGNVAEGVMAALESGRGRGKAYNLTNDGPITGDELVAGLAKGLQRRVRSIHLPRGIARLSSKAAFLAGGNPYSSAAAIEELGWRPSHRHAEALPRAVRAVLEAGT